MAELVLNNPLIDTGPCTDPTANFQALASILDALGNPGPDPGPDGPIGPDGTPVDPNVTLVGNVYVTEEGVLVKPDPDNAGEVIIVNVGGANSSTATFTLRMRGTLADPQAIDEQNSTFTLSNLTAVEQMDLRIPFDDDLDGETKLVPDVTSGTITVYNTPPIAATIADSTDEDDQIHVRYDFTDKKWHPDSLHNWEKHAKGRASYDVDLPQVLGHDPNTDDPSGSAGIIWTSGTSILVRVGGIGAGLFGDATRLVWNGSGWGDGETVTVHNRSQTTIVGEIEITAVSVDGQYVLSWPDFTALTGRDSTDAQVPYFAAGSDNLRLGGGDCDS